MVVEALEVPLALQIHFGLGESAVYLQGPTLAAQVKQAEELLEQLLCRLCEVAEEIEEFNLGLEVLAEVGDSVGLPLAPCPLASPPPLGFYHGQAGAKGVLAGEEVRYWFVIEPSGPGLVTVRIYVRGPWSARTLVWERVFSCPLRDVPDQLEPVVRRLSAIEKAELADDPVRAWRRALHGL